MDEALVAFYAECRELLDGLEDALLRLEEQPDDAETLNAIFRAAHTIKGTAGIFGLDDIVAFTHVAENVLDRLREGLLPVDGQLTGELLRTGDHLRRWVALMEADSEPDADFVAQTQDLQALLAARLGPAAATPPAAASAGPAPAPAAAAVVSADSGGQTTAGHWHLALRFGPDTLRDGFDPLSFLRYVGGLGNLSCVLVQAEAVPRLAELDPEQCHLAFDCALHSQADPARIASAFDFVRDESDILILPPQAPLHSLAERLAADPGWRQRLQACGTLAPDLLDAPEAAQDAGQAGLQPDPQAVEPLIAALTAQSQDAAAGLAAGLAAGPAKEAGAALRPPASTEPANPSADGAVPPTAAAVSSVLRVDSAKLDQLIDLVGELVIAGSGAAMTARRHKVKELVQATAAVTRLMEQVRDSALKLRMVQIGHTFGRFQRVVRDLSRELGKAIDLQISGEETELDKAMVERLADPLTHLVRNALDHGIESADARVAAGKTARGTLRLHARHEAGHVIVEVGDDGAGLNRERILRRARERGLVPTDSVLTDEQVYDLIFLPGFSTADTVSKLSGRGVGMDVVKRSITELRGSIEVHSQPGQGSRFVLRLPLTMAIIDGFLMAVGRATYVVPLDLVVECIDLARHPASQGDWLDLRGQVLPLVRLRELHQVQGSPGRRQNVVVVQSGNARVGLVVDQLMGELQTVIKPLGRVFSQVRGIGGFTILGNGVVALLLDVPGLVREATRQPRDAAAPGHRPPAPPAAAKASPSTQAAATSG